MAYIEGEQRGQHTLFPTTLDELISKDHVCRVIEAFVDRLDMAKLGFVRSEPAETGRPGYDPRDLLKLYLYGYLWQIRSSRRLETECQRNEEVMWLRPEGYAGDISRVVVNNCKFNSWSLMRLYTTNGSPSKFRINDVKVSNCSGRLAEAAFLIGLTNGSNPNSVASLTVSDCWLTAPTILAIAENFGTIILKNVTHVPSQSNVVWVPPQPNHVCGFLRSSPLYGSVTSVGSSLQFENCAVFRNNDIDCAAVVLENDSRIENVAVNGLVMQGNYAPVPVLLDVGGGSIGKVVLDSVDSTNFKSPVSPPEFSNIGLVSRLVYWQLVGSSLTL